MTYDAWKTRSDLDDRDPDPWDDRDLEPEPIDYDEAAWTWMSAGGANDEHKQIRAFENHTLEHLADEAIRAWGQCDPQIYDRKLFIIGLRRLREHLGVSECDPCGKMRHGCIDLQWGGMDTHACPKCRGHDSAAYGEYVSEDKLDDHAR